MPNISELAEQLSSDDQVAAYKATQALKEAAWRAGKSGAAALAAELAAAYSARAEGSDEPKYPARTRGILAQALSLVGGDAEVPVLRAAAQAAPDREMARFALERIPGGAATEALIEAARQDVGTEFRVGAIGALGRRCEPAATAALKELAADGELEIRLAALEALACHPDASSDALLAQACAQAAHEREKARLAKARVRLADTLAQAGQKEAAKAVFQAVAQSEADGPQKQAASRALAELG
jgi:hypothetical protein